MRKIHLISDSSWRNPKVKGAKLNLRRIRLSSDSSGRNPNGASACIGATHARSVAGIFCNFFEHFFAQFLVHCSACSEYFEKLTWRIDYMHLVQARCVNNFSRALICCARFAACGCCVFFFWRPGCIGVEILFRCLCVLAFSIFIALCVPSSCGDSMIRTAAYCSICSSSCHISPPP